MKVIKITDEEGNVFYQKVDESAVKVEMVEMEEDEYDSIPATQDSYNFFLK